MSTVKSFRLPDVGEGLTEAEIVQWHVKVGDAIKINDPIVEIETAKSVVELPSPFAGTVHCLLADPGTMVPVGEPIIEVQTGDDGPSAMVTPAQSIEPVTSASGSEGGSGAILVGYGTREDTRRGPRKAASAESSETRRDFAVPDEAVQMSPATRAKPPIRKLAKQLGVDLTLITPSGPGAVVTREDLKRFTERAKASGNESSATARDSNSREERTAVRGVRRATAEAMVRSASTAPHVTEFITADFTRTLRTLRGLQHEREFRDVRLSLLTLVARSVCLGAAPASSDQCALGRQHAGYHYPPLHKPRYRGGHAARTAGTECQRRRAT